MNSGDKPSVLLTGASGFVGRAVVSGLERSGWTVIASGRGTGALGIDLAANDAMARLSQLPAVDAVVHLAAATPGLVRADDEVAAEMTLRMDRTVLDYARRRAAHFVYASGCSLYDNTSQSWKDERSPIAGSTPYLRAKAIGDAAAAAAGAAVLRISGPYGPGMPGHVVLGRFLNAAASDETIMVWGSGRREQDFVHVQDIAAAVSRVLALCATGVFNIAASRPVTMVDLAQAAVAAAGAGKVVLADRPDPQDGRTARFDTAKATADLGWSAERFVLSDLAGLSGRVA